MKRIRKAARVTSVVVAAILTALVVTVLCAPEEDRIALTEMMDGWSDRKETSRRIDWESLPEEVIAWIEVPGTNIDEPIVQASPDSPNAYLYKDVFKQGGYGTPYIDYECSIDSRFVMVYGHHMSDGTAFAEFADFVHEGFARDHSRIIVYKRSGETLELEVCAVDVVNASKEQLETHFNADNELYEYIHNAITESDIVLNNQQYEEGIFWAFATCSYQTSNSRTVVYSTIKPRIENDITSSKPDHCD